MGVPPAGCTTPLITVDCTGTTTLGKSSGPADAGAVDSGSSDVGIDAAVNDAAVNDAAADAAADAGESDASTGVTCVVKRRNNATCTYSVTTETNVRFYLESYNGDPERGIATSSQGILNLYNTPDTTSPLFTSTAAHEVYYGYEPTKEVITRTGNTISVSEHAGRVA